MTAAAGASASAPTRPPMSDQELLRAYAESRDADSLSSFLARYEGSLVRFTGRLLEDPEAAQDVVQEAFTRVARRPDRLLGVDSCHNWLLRVARDIGLSRIRGSGSSPSGALETSEARRSIRDAVACLSPRQRELLLLKVQEGKSYREIAEITGLSVTNVGRLLHAALKALSVQLEPFRGVLS